MKFIFRFMYLMGMKFHQYISCGYYRALVGSCGSDFRIYGAINIKNPSRLYLGSGCSINDGVYINAFSNIVVGDNVAFSAGSKVIATALDVSELVAGRRTHVSLGIKIGSNVQIGAGAVILDGVTIGDDVVVGAGAVVVKDVSSRTVVVGVPAKVVKEIR